MNQELQEPSPTTAALGPSPSEQAAVGRFAVVGALASVYLVWGSTYLAVRIGLEGIPPFLLAGVRFFTAGLILYAIARRHGAARPTWREIGGGAIVGALLLGIGNGGVVYAEQTVASGLTALGVATVPLWVAVFSGVYGIWPTRREWFGLIVGFAGLVLLNLDSGLRASPAGAIAILVSPIGWSIGSVWSRRLPLPPGNMASAVEMTVGGLTLLAEAVVHHERLHGIPPVAPILSLIYLIAAGIVGFTAYVYLLRHVRPALATSYAYVNPVVAMMLGAAVMSEPISRASAGALILIVAGVAMVAIKQKTMSDTTA